MTTRCRPVPVLVALTITVVVIPAYWWAPVPRGVLIDLLGVVLLATAVVGMGRDTEGAWPRRLLWMATGALVVTTIGAAAWMPPWVALVAVCIAVGCMRRTPRKRGLALLGTLGLVASGALLNTYVLGALTTHTPLSAEPAAFRGLDLRAHSLLSDVPLRDVWAIDLPGGGVGRSLVDLRDLPEGDPRPLASRLPEALAVVRLAVGWVLGWDVERPSETSVSYANRLTAADRRRCLRECPGPRVGAFGFRLLLDSRQEVIMEVQNRTAHAFVVMAMAPRPNGQRLYVAIFVKPTGWLTPVYMATIDPFRRLVVYPSTLWNLQRRWLAKWQPTAADRADAGVSHLAGRDVGRRVAFQWKSRVVRCRL